MAEMRLAVDVINRGGDVKPFAHYRTASLAHKTRQRQSRLQPETLRVIMLPAVAENQP
jgi:hypothetical protein